MTIVNTDFNSIFTVKQVNKFARAISLSTIKLSSGKKLNYSSDNPSGVIASNRFKAQLGGIRKATFNAEDASSLLKTADSALDETMEILLRMKEIAILASNRATLTSSEITSLDDEFQTLNTEISNKVANATFNNENLLSGAFAGGQNTQIGPYSNQTASIVIPDVNGLISSLTGDTLLTSATASAALTDIDATIDNISVTQASIGAQERVFERAINDLSAMEVNIASALSNITDVDMASEISHFARLQIMTQSATAMLAQANYVPGRLADLLDNLPS